MELLDECKKGTPIIFKIIAMVGLSPKTDKPSNRVAQYMMSHGYRVILLTPSIKRFSGKKHTNPCQMCQKKIDVLTFSSVQRDVVPVVEEAIKLKPKVIMLQLDIVNDEAKGIAEKNGIDFVQNLCIKLEHARLFKTSKK
jgi:predicted CoA-binding protein